MRLLKKASERLGHGFPSLAGGLRRAGGKTMAALLSRRFAVTLLVAAIAAELCMLGIGVVRRLEMAAQQAEEAAKAELAAMEAQAFAREFSRKRSGVGIVASEEQSEETPQDEDEEGHDAAPPLRARDVATILAQETGTLPDDDFSAPGAEEQTGDAPSAGGNGLSEEDSEEVDELIRKGFAAMVAGDMRRCILCLEQARELAPKHPAMLYYCGMAYDKLLNPAKAREYYTQVFHLRDAAGKYFALASRRLTYGFEQPADMRGKLSFGPRHCSHTYGEDEGERVELVLPILLAPGESVRTDDIYINVEFFVLVNNRRIEFSHFQTTWAWQNKKPTWNDAEENLVITHTIPPLTAEEKEVYGDVSYYGFTAKIYYKGEPLDCISTPAALILQEQRLNNRRAIRRPLQPGGLFPEDDASIEQATPYSEFIKELEQE